MSMPIEIQLRAVTILMSNVRHERQHSNSELYMVAKGHQTDDGAFHCQVLRATEFGLSQNTFACGGAVSGIGSRRYITPPTVARVA